MGSPPKSNARDDQFSAALASLAPEGVHIGHRWITVGDEDGLVEAERDGWSRAGLKSRRQSGAVRLLARSLMERQGIVGAALPRGASRAPIWPAGVVGSLAHDSVVAVAAVAHAATYAAIGIDVEPPAPLSGVRLAAIATQSELDRCSGDPLSGRILLAAKEAVYKALNPTDGLFLGFHDVEVDLGRGRATTRGGRAVALAWTTHPWVTALAYVRRP